MNAADVGILWTIGHSIRPWQEFAALLAAANIEVLADVRRFAGSRRNPQFNGETMGLALATSGIAYVPMPELGGRRPPRIDSPNIAWRNAGFRGYADYMGTNEYGTARERLAEIARTKHAVVMCAEAMWWQCHRSLISDDFKARGWRVMHLLSPGREQEHPYTAAARIVGDRLDYTAPTQAGPQASLF